MVSLREARCQLKTVAGAGAEAQQWWTCANGCGFKRPDFFTVSQHEAICEGPSAEAELSEESIKAREAKKRAAAAPAAAACECSCVHLLFAALSEQHAVHTACTTAVNTDSSRVCKCAEAMYC